MAEELQDIYASRIGAIYERVELQLIELLRQAAAGKLKLEGGEAEKLVEIRAFRAAVELTLKAALAGVPAEMADIIKQAYEDGAAAAGAELKAARVTQAEPQAYTRAASIRAIASEAVGGVEKLNRGILRSTLDAYREVIASGVEDIAVGAATRQQSVQRALDSFADRGVSGFRDAAGRRWGLQEYSEMATRTGVIRGSVAGKLQKYQAAGVDLVIVSDHWEECELCEPWEGRVLSSTGATPGYPTVADAEADGLFHPNCRHTLSPHTPKYATEDKPQTPKNPAEQKLVYKERLQQRRLERGVRQWKRRELAALDDETKAKAKAKVKSWRAALKSHVQEVNERRSGTGVPAMKNQPGRTQVMTARGA